MSENRPNGDTRLWRGTPEYEARLCIIKELRVAGKTYVEIGKVLGISSVGVLKICQKPAVSAKKGSRAYLRKRNEAILERLRDGFSRASVAAEFGLTPSRIAQIDPVRPRAKSGHPQYDREEI